MIMLLFSEMCFMQVCFLICAPDSKLKYLFAPLSGITAILLAVGHFIDQGYLNHAEFLAYFNTVAMTGSLIWLKKQSPHTSGETKHPDSLP